MSLTIRNSVDSLRLNQALSKTSNALSASSQRLSSGLKANRGVEGPASSMVMSERQQAQINNLQTAVADSNNAISLVQTGEGALNETTHLLSKARSLALASVHNGNDEGFNANEAEIENILSTIDRIANTTQYGARKLMDGSISRDAQASNEGVEILSTGRNTAAGEYKLTVTQAAERASVTAAIRSDKLSADETLTINGTEIELKENMTQEQVIEAINDVSDKTNVVAARNAQGSTQLMTQAFGSEAALRVISTRDGSGSAGFSTCERTGLGVDAEGSLTLTNDGSEVTAKAHGQGQKLSFNFGEENSISLVVTGEDATDLERSASGAMGAITVTDNSLRFQIGVDASQCVQLSIGKISTDALGKNYDGNKITSLADIDITSSAGASEAVKVIDQAMSEVSALRGRLGDFQNNTLEANAKNLQATLENTVAAESVIRDTDFASEIAGYTKNQMLLQGGRTVLGNANMTSQLVLSLFR